MEIVSTKVLRSAGIAITMAMTAWLPLAATAADAPMKPMKGGEHQTMLLEDAQQKADSMTSDGKMKMEGKMMAGCEEMKAQKHQLKADMKVQDAAITEQLANMNSASEDKKMGLMAAVITQMVENRMAMDARKAKMEEAMMQHMMQHMQMGKESMSQCPMMKGMKAMTENSTDAHIAHQEHEDTLK